MFFSPADLLLNLCGLVAYVLLEVDIGSVANWVLPTPYRSLATDWLPNANNSLSI